ncbi:MAG: HPr family phosphocarrier protein [Herpetosiphonaceae bacterium]|nr:HPr family phosphocarrier protein [Herpetosiphonaceae bacterium]
MPETHELVLTISHPNGLHLRPAALFVRTAAHFHSAITVRNLSRIESHSVDAKSMFGLMQLGVAEGHQIELHSIGVDATAALLALQQLVASDFEEQP